LIRALRRWLEGPWILISGLSLLTGWWLLFVIAPIGALTYFMRRWDAESRAFAFGASLVGLVGLVWLYYVYETHTSVADRVRRLLTVLMVICVYLQLALYVLDPHRPAAD
jgi:hypothetical protein